MNYKVSTYKFSIQNKYGENFPLGNLPGNIDFLNLFNEFCQDIIINTKKFNENGRNKSLTLREPQKLLIMKDLYVGDLMLAQLVIL
ncbi:hypothetical protein EVD19_10390 [Elizabethkingia meningoseptica]|nr:hypothetical protein EVD19_10390 [Elizabethkingia meningoseptica]